MIRGLRQKFILVAMLSTFVVLAAILGTVNISNYYKMVERADEMTDLVSRGEGPFGGHAEDKKPPEQKQEGKEIFRDEQDRLSPETPFETRYFTVTADDNEKITSSDLDNIAAVEQVSL